jgi:hypothetical protein
MFQNRIQIERLKSLSDAAERATESVRVLLAERRKGAAAIAAKLANCPSTIEAIERLVDEEEKARIAEWEAEKAVVISETAEFCAARRLELVEEARADAEAAAEQARRDVALVEESEALKRLSGESIQVALTKYPPAARAIRSLLKTEMALGPLIEAADKDRTWGLLGLKSPVILTHPRVLGSLTLPNFTDDAPRYPSFWDPHIRIADISRSGPFVDVRDDIIAPFRTATGEALPRLIAAASEMIRVEYLKCAAEIVDVLMLWSRAWVRIERFNAAVDDRRRLALPSIELPDFAHRRELRPLPRITNLPALQASEPPIWDGAADLPKIAGIT